MADLWLVGLGPTVLCYTCRNRDFLGGISPSSFIDFDGAVIGACIDHDPES